MTKQQIIESLQFLSNREIAAELKKIGLPIGPVISKCLPLYVNTEYNVFASN